MRTDTGMSTATAMTEPTPLFPLELQVWLSPTFPVGSFAYSHGLEWAVEAGLVRDRGTARDWLEDLLTSGGPRNDAILLACAWRAACEGLLGALAETNELALALAGARERLLETSMQGNAFLTTVEAAWPSPDLADLRAGLAGDVAYPVAVGLAAGTRRLPLPPTLRAFCTATIGNLVSALVRLSAIGQTDGQRILAGLLPVIENLAGGAAHATLEDLGGAAFLSDIAAIAHETQHTRLFRS